jgi:hypothetical protein
MNLHLTHEQLCELIFADLTRQPSSLEPHGSDVVEQHLRACLICSAELKSLRDSLANFRDASASFARQEFAQSYAHRSSIAPPHRYLTQPLYWAAAVVILVAALFPLTMRRDHVASSAPAQAALAVPQTTESDDQLLADIDQKLSADVPSPMEPLADPMDGTVTTTSHSDQRKN